MNVEALMKRAEKVIKAHNDKKNIAKVHIIDANNTHNVDKLNGLVIAVNKD